jgi:hypothetical protein
VGLYLRKRELVKKPRGREHLFAGSQNCWCGLVKDPLLLEPLGMFAFGETGLCVKLGMGSRA